MKKILLISFLLSGCATVFDGDNQSLNFITTKPVVEKTACIVSNEEETLKTSIDNSFKIHKDGNNLIVVCQNKNQIGEVEVEPEIQYEFLLLDIITGSLIPIAVDAYTNAVFEYPNNILIDMRNK